MLVNLQPLSLGPDFETGATVLVALCAELPGPEGDPALVPLVARAVRVPAAAASPAAVTAVLPITLPAGGMPGDMVVMLLRQREWPPPLSWHCLPCLVPLPGLPRRLSQCMAAWGGLLARGRSAAVILRRVFEECRSHCDG